MKLKQEGKYAADYTQLKSKLYIRLFGSAAITLVIIALFYMVVWRNRGGNFIMAVCQTLFGMDYESARSAYQYIFRNNAVVIWGIAIALVFFALLGIVSSWFIRYFDMVNRGIDALLTEETEIHLPSELLETERKLNTARQTLKQRAMDVQLAEQRKNDLVMYLAHDIRTPLTSVIGYLNLLEEAPDMPMEQKAKYVHITLDKAYSLEKMMNEFFEITRYNLQRIILEKESIDLYYMLVQLTDELSPILIANGNTVILKADENLTVYGDPDKLARVFNNVLKNAAAYSLPSTEIIISAKEMKDSVQITFENQGKDIPEEKLASIFEKFYRLDEARTSNAGGSGLGLAIAREIISLHGGTISAVSQEGKIVFHIILPIRH